VVELTLRIIFSLLVVLALMWGLAKLARRPLGARRGGLLSVVARQQLSRGSSVAVVQVAGKALVLGVTDHQVTLLAETDPSTLDVAAVAPVTAGAPLRPVADRRPAEQLDVARLNAALREPPGAFNGSLLSPDTWSRTWTFLRTRRSK
jgi:flagellar protein FliO/FliZ